MYIHIRIHIHIYTYIHIYVCACVRVCVCVYVYIISTCPADALPLSPRKRLPRQTHSLSAAAFLCGVRYAAAFGRE
jgi:hypothetical protein